MKTQIKTWGNSQAIRIPKDMLEEAGFHDCDDLNIEVWDHKIVISKIHRRLSLEELSVGFHLSEKYISRYFREHFHLSLTQYVNYLRLTHARHLLETTALAVTEVAMQCGFPNVSYFIRTFKNTFHVPPLQYRNSIR